MLLGWTSRDIGFFFGATYLSIFFENFQLSSEKGAISALAHSHDSWACESISIYRSKNLRLELLENIKKKIQRRDAQQRTNGSKFLAVV